MSKTEKDGLLRGFSREHLSWGSRELQHTQTAAVSLAIDDKKSINFQEEIHVFSLPGLR